LIAVIMVV